jgi:hypothetical protein
VTADVPHDGATQRPTAAQLERELEASFIESDLHGDGCSCCERVGPTLATLLTREAFYAFDRYRPDEGFATSNEEIDELVAKARDAALAAARRAVIDSGMAWASSHEAPRTEAT